MSLRHAVVGAVYRTLQEHFPRTYLKVITRRGADFHPMTAESDLVIAGAPGSANSFVRSALLAKNPGLRIASHAHVWSELPDAVELGRPVLLLVREPEGAAASRMTRFNSDTPSQALTSYARYYRHALEWKDRVVVADFSEATARVGDVIRRVNARYGTEFVPFPHEDPTAVAELHALLSSANGAVPTGTRSAEKDAARRALSSPDLAGQLAECRRLYETLTRTGEPTNAP